MSGRWCVPSAASVYQVVPTDVVSAKWCQRLSGGVIECEMVLIDVVGVRLGASDCQEVPVSAS